MAGGPREYRVFKDQRIGLWQAYRVHWLFGVPTSMPVQIAKAYRSHADAIAAVDADLARRRVGTMRARGGNE